MLVPNKRLVRNITEAYKKDPDLKLVIQQPKEPFEIRNGLLYRESRLCIPQGEIGNKLSHDYRSTPSKFTSARPRL